MRRIKSPSVLWLVMVLIMICVMAQVTAGAAEKSTGRPKITLNSSDPFEFSTVKDKQELLDEAGKYPEKFDLRDEGCVTHVKLQNPFGSCWGFAAIGAAETSILGSGLAEKEGFDVNTINLSEKHLAYFASSYIDEPGFSQNGEGTHHAEGVSASEILGIGGNPVLATNTFASGTGPVYESKSDEYVYKGKEGNIDKRWFAGRYQNFSYSAEDDWSIDKNLRFMQNFVLKESYMLPEPAVIDVDENNNYEYSYNPAGTVAIKEQLYKKRGVEIGFSADTSLPSQDAGDGSIYVSTNWAHYTWQPAPANHAVQIIGWDDNYPRDNFIAEHKPPEDMFPDGRHEGAVNGGNGAWLVKNSWGSGEMDFPNKGEGNWGIVKDGVHTGYFWLSYYDQSISMPEALEFDKANTAAGYYLDQYDFMQAHRLLSSEKDKEAKMANIFEAEVCEELEAVSCQTTHPNTHVEYEVYLLQEFYQNPEDGILVARMENTYDYGGFHKEAVKPCGILGNGPVIIQKGQCYSIVITQKTADGQYSINVPVGFAYRDGFSTYDVGIINERESYVWIDDCWNDYSDESFRSYVIENPGIEKPVFDNFPIKGFCRATGNDIAVRLTGGSEAGVFRGRTVTKQLRMTGSKDAVIPEDPEITWTTYDPKESGVQVISLKELNNGSKVVITPMESGRVYIIINVEGVGTTITPFIVYRFRPAVAIWHDHDEENKPIGAVYTGKPLEPGVDISLDSPYGDLLIKDVEYTITYNDNIKCGIGFITVEGAGELEPYGFSEPFPITPARAEVIKTAKGPGSVTVTVKDQKQTGITGYVVSYRPAGSGAEWKTAEFDASSTKLTVKGLEAGMSYEVGVQGRLFIPPQKRGWALYDHYDGEMSDVKTVKVTEPSKVSIKTLKANKKKKSVTVKWKTVSGISGYQIQYSTDKKFRRAVKKVNIKKTDASDKVIKKLSKAKKYYFRIRTFNKTAKSRIYSRWSAKKSVKL